VRRMEPRVTCCLERLRHGSARRVDAAGPGLRQAFMPCLAPGRRHGNTGCNFVRDRVKLIAAMSTGLPRIGAHCRSGRDSD
jgi:hypothetical protein